MKEKLNEIFNSDDQKRIDKAIKLLNKMYQRNLKFKIIELCQVANIKTGCQNLDEKMLSYAAFNSEMVIDKFKSRNLIVVNDNLDLKEKRVLFAYHFFQYILNDSAKSDYQICYDFYTNEKPYELALELFLPRNQILKKYNEYMDRYNNKKVVYSLLSDDYLVPVEDVSRRIYDIKNKNNNKRLFKEIKRI